MWEAELLKSLLEAANIDSFVKNNVLSSYAFEPIGAVGVKLMISDANLLLAQEIVADFNKSK